MVEQQKLETVYSFQQKAMPVLIGWAIGSIVMGLLWWRHKDAWWKGFGSQFAGWGVINALIGILGLRGANNNQNNHLMGGISEEEQAKALRFFEIALWVNAILDIGYVVGGQTLATKNPDDPQKQGMGWGIMAQGTALFAWDTVLGLLLLRWKANRD